MCVCGDGDRSRGRGAVGEQRRWRKTNKQTHRNTGKERRGDKGPQEGGRMTATQTETQRKRKSILIPKGGGGGVGRGQLKFLTFVNFE